MTPAGPAADSPARAPVCLFVYNRPEHARRTLESLRNNLLAPETALYVFSDGPKGADAEAVRETRDCVRTVSGFRSVEIVERDRNLGLAESVMRGVSTCLERHETVIVLEDDMLTSPHFLSYLNDGLDLYRDDERVASIHGYVYPAPERLPASFFLRGADCWGWATWRRAWRLLERDGRVLLRTIQDAGWSRDFNFDGSFDYLRMLRDQVEGRNNSWAIRWYASAYVRGMVTLYPGASFVENIGLDASGTHCGGQGDALRPSLAQVYRGLERIDVVEDRAAKAAIARFLRSLRPGLLAGMKRRLACWALRPAPEVRR